MLFPNMTRSTSAARTVLVDRSGPALARLRHCVAPPIPLRISRAQNAPLQPTRSFSNTSNDTLIAEIPSILQSKNPHAIQSHYALLCHHAPHLLDSSDLVSAYINALGPFNVPGCFQLVADWHARCVSPEYASSKWTSVLDAYLQACARSKSPPLYIESVRNLVHLLMPGNPPAQTPPFNVLDRVISRFLGRYALDLYDLNIKQIGPAALEFITHIESAGVLNWDPYRALLLRVQALGLMADSSSLLSLLSTEWAQLPSGTSNIQRIISKFNKDTEIWVTALARADLFDLAQDLFTAMADGSTSHPSLESAHALLLCSARTRDVPATVDLHKELIEKYGPNYANRDRPGEDLYSPVLQACWVTLSKNRFARYTRIESVTHRIYVAKVFLDTRAQMTELGVSMALGTHELIVAGLVLINYDDHYRMPMKTVASALEHMISDGHMVTHHALHSIMRGYANTKEEIHVLDRLAVIAKYMQVMRVVDLPVTSESFSIAFLALLADSERALVPRVLELERDMQASGITHCHQSMHAFLRVLGTHYAFVHMYRAFQSMPHIHLPRTEDTYFTVFHACAQTIASAEYALHEILAQMVNDKVPLTANLAHTIMSCCVTVNNEFVAWHLYTQIGKLGLPVTHTLLNYLLKVALFNNRLPLAQFVFNEFCRRNLFFDATTYYHLMTYYTRISPNIARVKAILELLNAQTDIANQYSQFEPCLSVDDSYSLHDNGDAYPAVQFHGLPADLMTEINKRHPSLSNPFCPLNEPNSENTPDSPLLFANPIPRSDHLDIPPLPPLPAKDCTASEKPIRILIDSRLHLKLLQLYVHEGDLHHSFAVFSSLLCDYHVAMLHRFVSAHQYKAEAVHEAQSNPAMCLPMELFRLPVLSFPPKIVQYKPYSRRAGMLYIPRDLSTATWMMCSALLDYSGTYLPAAFPTLRYLYIDPASPKDIHSAQPSDKRSPHRTRPFVSADQEYLSRIKFRELTLAGRHKLAVARVLFRATMRLLKVSVQVNLLIRFEWVKDMIYKLGMRVDFNEQDTADPVVDLRVDPSIGADVNGPSDNLDSVCRTVADQVQQEPKAAGILDEVHGLAGQLTMVPSSDHPQYGVLPYTRTRPMSLFRFMQTVTIDPKVFGGDTPQEVMAEDVGVLFVPNKSTELDDQKLVRDETDLERVLASVDDGMSALRDPVGSQRAGPRSCRAGYVEL